MQRDALGEDVMLHEVEGDGAVLVVEERPARAEDRRVGEEQEVVSTLRGWVLGRDLDPDRAAGALEDFRALDITLLDMLPLIDGVWSLRHSITAYDAMYVALARAMDSPLLTLDARLIAALPTDVRALKPWAFASGRSVR